MLVDFQKKKFAHKIMYSEQLLFIPFWPFFGFSKVFRVIATYFYKGRAINLAYSTLDGSTYPPYYFGKTMQLKKIENDFDFDLCIVHKSKAGNQSKFMKCVDLT